MVGSPELRKGVPLQKNGIGWQRGRIQQTRWGGKRRGRVQGLEAFQDPCGSESAKKKIRGRPGGFEGALVTVVNLWMEQRSWASLLCARPVRPGSAD